MELEVVDTEPTLRRRGARHQKGQKVNTESQREVVSQHVSCNIFPQSALGSEKNAQKLRRRESVERDCDTV
jgi:hypothetical protein